METSAHGITAPSAVYEIAGRRFEIGSQGFAEAVADAHSAHQRPRCLCVTEGVEMYVARLGEGYIVKRMPDTGRYHAPDCPSYEPPAEFSGLGQVLGSAITEDPTTGETTLKLDFPLARMPGLSTMPPASGKSDSVSSSGTRLSLRGLLHYLWDQAELTRWHPGFAGKRSWATVRRKLVQAALHKSVRGHSLCSRLYLPEPFSVDERDAINARRLAQWQQAAASPGKPQQLMLLIGEVKGIVPARYGYKALIKHLPDQPLSLDETLYRRLGRRFERELSLWGASEGLRLIAIATFWVNVAGVPMVDEVSLMATNAQWIPIEDAFELQLVNMLVSEDRSFTKALRYDLASMKALPSATLLDAVGGPCALIVDRPPYDAAVPTGLEEHVAKGDAVVWLWPVRDQAMPALPATMSRHPFPPPGDGATAVRPTAKCADARQQAHHASGRRPRDTQPVN